MVKIVIEIEADGKYCGECRLREFSLGCMYCNAFEGELKHEPSKGLRRLKVCLDSEEKGQP